MYFCGLDHSGSQPFNFSLSPNARSLFPACSRTEVPNRQSLRLQLRTASPQPQSYDTHTHTHTYDQHMIITWCMHDNCMCHELCGCNYNKSQLQSWSLRPEKFLIFPLPCIILSLYIYLLFHCSQTFLYLKKYPIVYGRPRCSSKACTMVVVVIIIHDWICWHFIGLLHTFWQVNRGPSKLYDHISHFAVYPPLLLEKYYLSLPPPSLTHSFPPLPLSLLPPLPPMENFFVIKIRCLLRPIQKPRNSGSLYRWLASFPPIHLDYLTTCSICYISRSRWLTR